MKWKYKEQLKDESIFDKIETQFGRTISEHLREFIIETNGATPSNNKIMIGKNERVFGAVLSFNQYEKGTDSVFTALEAVPDKSLMPFAIDPFGNYFCLKKYDVVVFWNHETGKTTTSKKDLRTFILSLY